MGPSKEQLGGAQAAETTYTMLADLDASATNAAGPCWTCEAYQGLNTVRHLRGDYAGANDIARKWTALRPASANAWLSLANSLTLAGDIDGAEPAFARYRQLSDEGAFDPFTGRMFVMARRLDEAEEYARRFPASDDAKDLLATVQRERGQYRAAAKTYAVRSATHSLNGSELVYAHKLGASQGDARVRAMFEHVWHPPTESGPPSMYGPGARGYTWNHALEADALRARRHVGAARPGRQHPARSASGSSATIRATGRSTTMCSGCSPSVRGG